MNINICSRIMFSAILSCCLLVGGCHDELGPGISPGSRNYTWRIDTIYAPYNQFSRLSGTSPTDLWAVNSGDADKTIFHYDGTRWTTDLVGRPIVPASIHAINRNDVWIGALQGLIWHFDGVSWSRNYQHIVTGTTMVAFDAMFGTSGSNVYAAGACYNGQDYWGIILHYDGLNWSEVPIPKFRTVFVKMNLASRESNKYFLLGFTEEQFSPRTFQFYEFDGQSLNLLKTGTQADSELGNLLVIGEETRFVIGYDAYLYAFGQFRKFAHLTDSQGFLHAGIGRSEQDIFLACLDGIQHYNGSDAEYLVRFDNPVRIVGFQLFSNDVFFISRDEVGNNLIFHGLLTM